jgi:hypothetical protein
MESNTPKTAEEVLRLKLNESKFNLYNNLKSSRPDLVNKMLEAMEAYRSQYQQGASEWATEMEATVRDFFELNKQTLKGVCGGNYLEESDIEKLINLLKVYPPRSQSPGAPWVKASMRKPDQDKKVIVRNLRNPALVRLTENIGHNTGWDIGMDYNFRWDNTEWLDESAPTPAYPWDELEALVKERINELEGLPMDTEDDQYAYKQVLTWIQELRGNRVDSEADKILQLLCQLKAHKDFNGKDAFYEREQPLAWDRANDYLNSLVKPSPAPDQAQQEDK